MNKIRTIPLFFSLLLAIGLIPNTLFAQKQKPIKLPHTRKSAYAFASDSAAINYLLVDTVLAAYGYKPIVKLDGIRKYQGNTGFMGLHNADFSVFQVHTEIEVFIDFGKKEYLLPAGTDSLVYGFYSLSHEGNKIDRNFSQLLLSAYQQEMDEDYRNNAANFVDLNVLDKSEFWRRNWINMGYGMAYLGKDNAFMSGKGFATGFFYVWEGLHYIPILGGPFFGETQQDKIGIPLIGMASLLIWKTVFAGWIIGGRQLKINKMIKQGKYRIPKGLEY